ncbi:alkaline phosphatase family protein [Natronosalvus rutilus]|uniref:Alkaline phosphatase family protein n=1 Tax=Natronosalvus rutilus TaxID=2953753 RepID=A0A9E7SXF7_9EURY|nr:alkaline phosphatase family protein [Natronosalvus rutilus]UTF55016.1 alkaline phosphatase family protein [Natronosalvus rutilus]
MVAVKTVVFAFEGVTNRHLERFADAMPTVSGLQTRGVSGSLESTVPASPASAWTSLLTGTDPSYHGVFDDVVREHYPNGERRPASAVNVRRPTLWAYLSGEGASTVACGFPMTDPPGPVTGVVVPGRRSTGPTGGPTSGAPVDARLPSGSPGSPWTLRDLEDPAEVPTLLETRRRLACDLLDGEPWELALVHVPVADSDLLGAVDADAGDRALEAACRAADRLVQDVLEVTPEESTVIGCSPLGVERSRGYRVHVNEVLADHDLLERGARDCRWRPGVLESVLRVVSGALGGGFHASRKDADGYRWATSEAFFPSQTSAGIRLNVAGRERYGRVVNSTYEETRSRVLEALVDLADPRGNPALEFACRREHLYEGPFAREAPDILVSTAGTDCTVSAAPAERQFTRLEGVTRTDAGTFFASGPSIRKSPESVCLTAADVAPLVMATLGRPIPNLMTGRDPSALTTAPVGYGTYANVAHGTACDDPTFDDARLGERLEEFDYR